MFPTISSQPHSKHRCASFFGLAQMVTWISDIKPKHLPIVVECGLHMVTSLLVALWSQNTKLLRTTRNGAKPVTKKCRRRNDTKFTSILCRSQLSRETQAASNAAHRTRQMIQVTISWGDQFQSPETNVEQSFVVQERFVGVFQLVEAHERLDRRCQFYHNK